MTVIAFHHTYGKIVVDEDFWTGKKTVTVNSQTLDKVKRNTYLLPDRKELKLKGSIYIGLEGEIDGERFQIGEKASALEIILLLLPFIVNMTLGNTLALSFGIPVVSGAIGGGISGAVGAAFLPKIKEADGAGKKVLWALAATGLSLVICTVIGFIFVVLFS